SRVMLSRNGPGSNVMSARWNSRQPSGATSRNRKPESLSCGTVAAAPAAPRPAALAAAPRSTWRRVRLGALMSGDPPNSQTTWQAGATVRSSMRLQLQLAKPVIDDERIEQTECVHADQEGRLTGEVPVLEDPHLAVGDARPVDLDPAQDDRRAHEHLSALHRG